MNQYADMRLDLADASLISAAERIGEPQLCTIDKTLAAVQLADVQFPQIVPSSADFQRRSLFSKRLSPSKLELGRFV